MSAEKFCHSNKPSEPYPTKGYLNLKPIQPPSQQIPIEGKGFKFARVYQYSSNPVIIALFTEKYWADKFFTKFQLSSSCFEIREVDD
jgi:hypothetical protein